MPSSSSSRIEHGVTRIMWIGFGLAAVAIGGIGIVVPGLPTTVFFIIAAWAFSKSSRRLEAWVLGLPRVGAMVADHRAGLGMPRRAKLAAIGMIVFFVGLSAITVDHIWFRIGVIALGLVGVAYIWFRVPTREDVVAARTGHPEGDELLS